MLDAKWCQQPLALGSSGAALLACATSTGRLGLYTLAVADAGEGVGECAQLQHSSSSDAEDSLLLSLDWSGGAIADAKVGAVDADWERLEGGGTTTILLLCC